MISMMIAAAVAAQPAPSADTHGQMAPMQHGQQEAMKDCCKDCCKDMAAKHAGKPGEHGDHAQ